jgi:hypothetical protein
MSDANALYTEDPSKLQPPRVLIDYVPLALLLNSILQAFNELRKCCPQSLQTPISTALFNALNHVVDLTVSVINAAKPEDKKVYAEFCRVSLSFVKSRIWSTL